jgi:hypothetical protein
MEADTIAEIGGSILIMPSGLNEFTGDHAHQTYDQNRQ